MSRPTVSVVIGAYNAAACIERSIDSALAQSAPASEILLCDDGSTDGTPDQVGRRYGDRVTLLRLPHLNASAARDAGVRVASGAWIAFLDADDWWMPDKLERQLDFVARHPGVKWLSSDGGYESERGVERESWLADYFEPVRERHGDLFPLLLQRCFPLTSSVLVERGCYEAVGGFDVTLVYSHDYDLWLRLAARWPGAVLADRLVTYWTQRGSLSRNIEGRLRDDLLILERISRGELRAAPGVRRHAALRASGKAFQLGVLCLRTQRHHEGRSFLRRGAGAGPVPRRAMALIGSLLPDAAIAPLLRNAWVRATVMAAREPAGSIGGRGEAA